MQHHNRRRKIKNPFHVWQVTRRTHINTRQISQIIHEVNEGERCWRNCLYRHSRQRIFTFAVEQHNPFMVLWRTHTQYTRFMLAHINHFWHDKHALQFRRGSPSEAIRIMDSFHCSAVSLYSSAANAFQLYSSVRWKRNKTGLFTRKCHGELADALLSCET